MNYPDWYLYYRLMQALPGGRATAARIALQDVLCDLRDKAAVHWPEATQQEIQDWFTYLSGNPTVFTVEQALHITRMEPWAHLEAHD